MNSTQESYSQTYFSRKTSSNLASRWGFISFLLLFCLNSGNYLQAQIYSVGNVVQDLTFTERGSGQSVQLSDLEGKIIVLDWFTYWCPFCQAAAPDLLSGIDNWYSVRGGNPDGIDVVHVGVNLQANAESQTQTFVNVAGFDLVWEDFNRSAISHFSPSNGQPIFAIINGVENSPSHDQWELIFFLNGYGQTNFPVASMRAAIDAVDAASSVTPVSFISQPQGKSAHVGGMLTLTASASGTGPIAYYWYRNDSLIAGATMSSLELDDLNPADSGQYRLLAENAAGQVWSSIAEVTVLSRPYLRGLHLQPDGEARVELQAHAGFEYEVEYSSDLVNWSPLQTITPDNDTTEVGDTGAISAMKRFYRVMPVGN